MTMSEVSVNRSVVVFDASGAVHSTGLTQHLSHSKVGQLLATRQFFSQQLSRYENCHLE
jgi:hypothetical protein